MRITFIRTMSSPACQSSSGMSSSGPFGGNPVLLATASMRPWASIAAATSASRSSGRVTEPLTPMAPSSLARASADPAGRHQDEGVIPFGQGAGDRAAHPPAAGGNDRDFFSRPYP